MVYTNPRTWIDETSDAADFNADIRDNQLALKMPPNEKVEINLGTDYSTSSSTFSDIDGTNLSKSITTTGGDIMVGFVGTFVSAGLGTIDIAVNGTRLINQPNGGILAIAGTGALRKTASFIYTIQGLAAGTYTISLMWQTTLGLTLYAGAGTANYDVHPRFWVREMS